MGQGYALPTQLYYFAIANVRMFSQFYKRNEQKIVFNANKRAQLKVGVLNIVQIDYVIIGFQKIMYSLFMENYALI